MTVPGKLPVHIAFLTGFIPPYVLPVYQEIHRRVDRLTILLSTPMEGNRQWKTEWGELDVRVQKTYTHQSRWRHRIGFAEAKETHVPLDTLRRLRTLRPDVIVSEELGYRSLLCSVYQLLYWKTPLVLVANLSEHTEVGRGFLRVILRKWLARRAWTTTVNGQSGARYLRRIGFASDSIYLFPYTCKPGVFDRIRLERPTAVAHNLVTCGELSDRKGVVLLVDGLCRWCKSHRDRTVSLTMFGSGTLEDCLRQMSKPDNLTLEFMGYQDYDEVSRGFAQSGIFVFPTLADEWGLVVNEALAAGLPVLGSRFSQAADELIQTGWNGWVFDPTDPNDVVRALDDALKTPVAALTQMRSNCRASVAERTPAWAADKFLTAVHAACERKNNGRSESCPE